MNLTPREKDKLLVSLAAMVARNRLERGVKLNHPEAIALITDYVVEGARDGRSVSDLMEAGAHVVTRAQVHGGRARDDPRRAGRGHLSRRHQARHRASSGEVSAMRIFKEKKERAR
jgi:urease subunit gamma